MILPTQITPVVVTATVAIVVVYATATVAVVMPAIVATVAIVFKLRLCLRCSFL